MKLEKLIELGALSSELRVVDHRGRAIIPISELLRHPHKQQSVDVVIADGCKWAATVGKIPIVKASVVYSSDGDLVCSWNKEKRTFFIKRLGKDNSLHTVAQYKFPAPKNNEKEKENKTMANTGIVEPKVESADLDKIFGDAGVVGNDGAGNKGSVDTKQMNAFDEDPTKATTGDASTSTREATKKKEEEKVTAIKSYLENSGKTVRDNYKVYTFNQQHGRLKAFVTRTDKAVKVSFVSKCKLDAQGNKILREDASPEDVKKHNAFINRAKDDTKIKDAPAASFVKEKAIAIREANPGKIIAMVLGVPEGGFIDYGDLTKAGAADDVIEIDTSKTTERIIILDRESGLQFITDYFYGRIREDEKIVGSNAAWINLKYRVDPKSDEQNKVLTTMKIVRKPGEVGGRKKVLTANNYIPLKVYDTVNVSEIKSADEALALNNNINALLAKHSLEDLQASDRTRITPVAGGGYEYDCFKVGAGRKPIGSVARFDDATEVLTTVEIPRREKKVSDKGKITYPYVMSKDSKTDFLEKVASRKGVQKILDAINYTAEDFYDEISGFIKTRKSGGPNGGGGTGLTPDDIRLMHATDRASIKDLMAKIANVHA